MSKLDRLVSESFTNHCKSYDKYAVVQDLVALYLIDMISSENSLNSINYLLDVGAGTGKLFAAIFNHSKKFISKDTKLFASDISQGMLKEIKQKFPQVATFQEDFDNPTQLVFNHKFDLIISSFALQWSADPAKVITNYVKLLSDSGKIYFAIPVEGTLNELKQAFNKLGHYGFINNQIAPCELINKLLVQLQSAKIQIHNIINNSGNKSDYELLNEKLSIASFDKNESADLSVDLYFEQKDFTVNYDNIFDVFHSITKIGAGTRLEQDTISLNRQMIAKLKENYPMIHSESKCLFPSTYKIIFIKITKK